MITHLPRRKTIMAREKKSAEELVEIMRELAEPVENRVIAREENIVHGQWWCLDQMANIVPHAVFKEQLDLIAEVLKFRCGTLGNSLRVARRMLAEEVNLETSLMSTGKLLEYETGKLNNNQYFAADLFIVHLRMLAATVNPR